jgi:carbonic anhydrase/acetyltransferase-like protein (isoleucine patch superfamily)
MPVSSYLNTTPQLGEGLYLHPSAQVIGDVTVGTDCSIWCNTVLRGDVNRIVIGNCTNAGLRHGPRLAQECCQAGRFAAHHWRLCDHRPPGHLHGCTIGNEVLIGMAAIIMDDVVVQDQVMVGAGSLVPPGKVLESGHLYVGRPAAKVRALTPEEIAYLKYSAEHYVRVKNNYLQPVG